MRQRAHVDKLLARAPVTAEGARTLASGERLAYRVRAGFTAVGGSGLDAASSAPQAAIFTTAYTALGDSATPRPVCFVFNGGPGSSSVWLHLGAVGPKRVPVPDDGSVPPSPYTLVDNPHSWLAHFDLVFIDPPHTGWSVTASEAARKQMLGVDGDVDALAEVVRGWLAANGRFGAPLYLAGESYGTTRGAALADKLLDQGLGLDGVILVSCAMDLQSLVFTPRNDLPCALFVPAFAAVAQYHGRLKGALGASPQAACAAAEAFVADDYLGALHAGARLDGRARGRIERRLAELTGLPLAVVQEKNLRISDQCFFFELLREQGRIVGRLDARATGPMAAHRTRQWEFDPGMEALVIPYNTAALAYFAELGLPVAERYETISGAVNSAWNWQRKSAQAGGEAVMGFCSTSNDLSRALRRQPHLKLLVASGRYDLGTPYSASDWSLAQLDAPAEVLARITHHCYDAGHMMYTRSADLAQLQRDLAAWLAT
ncbi:MAG: peptidase S10 [Burkholderiales bacterium PBB5]|nr:MAG: peptidase S10 [Burkholderiales bacterium PBB5]